MKNKKMPKIIVTKHLPSVICILTLLGIIALVGYNLAIVIQQIQKLNHEQYLVAQCIELENKIDQIKKESDQFSNNMDENIVRIYNRVVELTKECPDEIRDAVVNSIDIKEMDAIERKAAVLALLTNYEELNNDIEVQTFLSDNLEIKLNIEKNNIILENTMKLFEDIHIIQNDET